MLRAGQHGLESRGSVSGSAPDRVPAWKRIGLKVKSTNNSLPETTNPAPVNGSTFSSTSDSTRASSVVGNADSQPAAKRRKITFPHKEDGRADTTTFPSPSALKRHTGTNSQNKKRVSFSAETKQEDGESAISVPLPGQASGDLETATSTPKKPNKSNSGKRGQELVEKKSRSALDYLTQFQTSREEWKFNKNKESWLLKNLFSLERIPSDYDRALLLYFEGLRSKGTRSRVRETAKEELAKANEAILSSKYEQKNTSTSEMVTDDPEARAEYRRIARLRFKRNYEEYLDSLEEVDEQEENPDRRPLLAKRRRAESVLWAVESDKEIEDEGEMSTKASGSASSTVTKSSTPTVSAQRRRKNRTTVVDVSDSSSEEESDSDIEKKSRARQKTSVTSKSKVTESDSSSANDSTSSSNSDSSDDESQSGSDSTSGGPLSTSPSATLNARSSVTADSSSEETSSSSSSGSEETTSSGSSEDDENSDSSED